MSGSESEAAARPAEVTCCINEMGDRVAASRGRPSSSGGVLAWTADPPGAGVPAADRRRRRRAGAGPDLRRHRGVQRRARAQDRLDARLPQARRHLPPPRRADRGAARPAGGVGARPDRAAAGRAARRRQCRHGTVRTRHRGLPAVHPPRRPIAARPLQAGASRTTATARPRRPSSRCARRSPSTDGSAKRTTCSVSACARAAASRTRSPRCAARWSSIPRSPRHARSWRSSTARCIATARASSSSRRSPRSSPTRPERLVRVGLAYARQGRTEAAIVTLGRAAERYPDDPAVYTALGRVWLESAELAQRPRRARQGARGARGRGRTPQRDERNAHALRPRAAACRATRRAAERTLQQAADRARPSSRSRIAISPTPRSASALPSPREIARGAANQLTMSALALMRRRRTSTG